MLVEWPARGSGWLPAPDLVVRLAAEGGGRRLAGRGESDFGRRWWWRFSAGGAVTNS